MKLRLGLVVLLFFPLLAIAQSTPKDIIFYSKGKMYVKYKDATQAGEPQSTTLYIDGSAKFVTGASIKQKGRTELTGDFVNGKDPKDYANDVPQLFVKDAVGANEGVIAFVGKPYEDASNVKWATLQRIYGVLDDDPSGNGRLYQKKMNWIDFPTISVEKGDWTLVEADATSKGKNDWRNVGLVVVDTSAAIAVDYIKADNKNRFAVNASYEANVPRINSGFAAIKDVHPSMKLAADGGSATDLTALARYSQVNLNLYKYEKGVVDDGAFESDDLTDPNSKVTDEATFGKTLRTEGSANIAGESGWNYLTGFSPPFEQLGADYMFYNTLTKPNGGSITSYEGPIVDPFFRMKAGRGYFISMEVSHADHGFGPGGINGRWDFENDIDGVAPNGPKGIHNTKRARGGYVFNRGIYQDYLSADGGQMENFSRFLYDNSENWFNPATYLPYKNSTTENIYVHGYNKWPLIGLKEKEGNTSFVDRDGKDRSRYELMEAEKFNTGDVEVDLDLGLNFLGNPFMFPISLNPLLGFTVNPISGDPLNPTSSDYGSVPATEIIAQEGFEVPELTPASAATPIKASSLYMDADPDVVLRAKYWVINQALVKYDVQENIFRYRTSYDYVSRDGSSTTALIETGTTQGGAANPGIGIPDPLGYLISPMQMFCVQASKPVKISLKPDALRRFGVTRFPKSASTSKASNTVLKDWFIVEASPVNSRIGDRTTIVFRDEAKAHANDGYDTRKGISEKFDSYDDVYGGKETKNRQEESKAIVYTKSKDGVSLLGNGIPQNTKEVALFYAAPATTTEMTLRFYGLENLESVPGVWLVDRYLDNKTIELTPETEYTFTSEASNEKNDEIDNRFILRFYDATGGKIENEDSVISCYYNNAALHILGLNEGDNNSDLTIYDLQGRLMAKTKVQVVDQRMDYPKALSLGTYVVKIAGKRNYTTKFVNLQN
ncbi:T9SS type A sorting domain-containing protein [Dysgonomonas sp. Marseille-P4677]|uniref:T9SS type A sorting domain-containing protein n=1 Tax=Dysgonomonas sp. Marseille-P4677 TaxID=2364790 RepID=UPI001912E6FF|nr:T9SS type A sorting domain-containing protein [Dysgonomonas sp. Marseille-P4677]MBK5720038.1 T9SS type A sorting domain-containing protein [Dysgonomonas sp. Marseille-P4677]